MSGPDMDRLYRQTYLDVHQKFIEDQPEFAELLS
jgi:hypothetical protein